MDKTELLRYELAGSDWWVSLISWGWAQTLVARYFAWKINRKFAALERVRQRSILVGAAIRRGVVVRGMSDSDMDYLNSAIRREWNTPEEDKAWKHL